MYESFTDKSEFGHVWLLTTLVYLLKMLYEHSCMVGGCVAQNPFLFCPLYVFIHFSAAFCTVHCALDLARVHAPQKLLLITFYIALFSPLEQTHCARM